MGPHGRKYRIKIQKPAGEVVHTDWFDTHDAAMEALRRTLKIEIKGATYFMQEENFFNIGETPGDPERTEEVISIE
jgi:hypothetical protein